jgi:two-component system, OmpR family, copper resistance phosphate regulon response regulator CusR
MRVLVVEDYKPVRDSVAKGLREAGFGVDVAGDGGEGLWMAENNEYDVIVLDLMLPKVSGLDVLSRLRQAGCQTHVLVLTARGDLEDRVRGLELGADDYLPKPFAFKELLARVRALVRREYRRKSPTLVVGELRLDTAAQRVWVGDEEKTLTAREYALLEYLVMRQGEVVSRTDIWNHLYDWLSAATSNVVDVYIGYLRKKLASPSLIQTVRGRGYSVGRDAE